MLVACALLVGCQSHSSATSTSTSVVTTDPAVNTDQPATSAPRPTDPPATTSPAPPPTIPTAPASLVLPTDPAAATTQLVDALEHGGGDRVPAVLTEYQLAGVPVIDASERSLTTTGDVAGVPWRVPYVAATLANEHARLPISDVARLFTADGHQPALDVAAVAQDLLTGLRTAASGPPAATGPYPIALVVREEAQRYNGVDLLDPATTPADVYVTVPTASVLHMAGTLTALTANRSTIVADASPGPSGLRRTARPAVLQTPSDCELDADGQWALWLISKIAGGADIPGMQSWEGVFGSLINKLGKYGSEQLSELAISFAQMQKLANAAAFVSAALTIITTIVAAMTYSADVRLQAGEPLVRTKHIYNEGAVDTLLVTVGYDFGSLGPDVSKALNCVLFALGSIGNNSTLPSPGPVGAGVTVTVQGQQGFGQGLATAGSFVTLHTPLQADTDSSGTAEFTVAGREQQHEAPQNADSYERTFSIAVKAKPDPTDINSILKMFFDSVLCAGGGLLGKGLGCVDPVNDVLRQLNWDLGTWQFKLTDWVHGYVIHDTRVVPGNGGLMSYEAKSCESLKGPWHIVVDFTAADNLTHDVSIDATFGDDLTGTMTGHEYSTWDSGLITSGPSNGTATLVKVGDTNDYTMTLDYTEDILYDWPDSAFDPIVRDETMHIHHSFPLKVTEALNGECG